MLRAIAAVKLQTRLEIVLLSLLWGQRCLLLMDYMIQILRDRGDKVVALARSQQTATQVTQLSAKAIRGDLLNKQAMI